MGPEKMGRVQIEEGLVRGISDIAVKAGGKMSADTRLSEIGLDSFMLVEIFVMVEKRMGIKLMESDIRKGDLETIRSLAAYIHSKI
jgi:acyl carrier protein